MPMQETSLARHSKNKNGAHNQFTSYSTNGYVIGSGFPSYGQKSNSVKHIFCNYEKLGTNPQNNFRSYMAIMEMQ